jgi:PIN domain nuclease of toxin-antitoxin system
VSAASLWEIAIKTSLGKLRTDENLPAVIDAEGFEVLPISGAHAWSVGQLSADDHRDPFDRMLAAQALSEGVGIVSRDPVFDRYGVERCW